MTTSLDARPARFRALGALGGWLPRAVDVFFVVAILLLAHLHGPDDTLPGNGWAWSVGLALPLLARRRWPVGVFAVISVVAFVQYTTGTRAFGDSALLVALYTVAATQPLLVTAGAATILEAGVVLAVTRWAGDHATFNAFIALSALATAAGVMGINVRSRRDLVASLHDRAARLELERDQQGQLSAAAERARIAREMHDIVAHNLAVMISLADGASYAVDDEPDRAKQAMRTASRTGRQALTEMRRLLGVLRDDPAADARAPQPGLGQIDALVEQVRAAGLPVSLAQAGSPATEVPTGLELAAFRIVQEALTNTLKHAGPGAQALVSLRWDQTGLQLEVFDTGHGTASPVAEGGGLRGMRERAAVYDGTVEVGPRREGGWGVRTELLLAAGPVELPA